MKLGTGRVVEAAPIDLDAGTGDIATRPRQQARRGRVVPPPVVDAAEEGRRVVERAKEKARLILDAARDEAAALRAHTAEEGRADAAAAIARQSLAFAARERAIDERALDRLVDLARLLAERLLGEALRLDPSRVTALARQALTEAQGARRIEIAAHPDDAPLLERELAGAGADAVVRIVPDATRPRGSLRFETDLGTLDADLAPQLDHLTKKLRAALSDG